MYEHKKRFYIDDNACFFFLNRSPSFKLICAAAAKKNAGFNVRRLPFANTSR